MFAFTKNSAALMRRGKAVALGIVAGLALGAVPGAALAQASVGDPTAAVAAGREAGAWYDGVTKGNWKETDEVSPGMHQIMTQALLDFSSYDAGKGCSAAAGNNAWGALADAANAGPLDAFLKAIKDSVVNIYGLAKFGADPSKAAEWLDADKLVDEYLKKVREEGQEELKKRVKDKFEEIWKGKPVEVLKRSSSRGGCDRVLIGIWDRATSSYEITIYGNCHCSAVALFGGGTALVKTYFVQLKGRVTPAVTDDGTLVLNIASPSIRMKTNCNCGVGGGGNTGKQPKLEEGGTAITDGGGTTGGGVRRDGDFWRKLTTSCPQCQGLVDKIRAVQAARDELDQGYRQANQELKMATEQKDKAGLDAANAKVNDLYKRDATLVKTAESLYAELRDCEAAKCPKGAGGGKGGNGPCVPKAPPLPPCPGEEDKRTGYLLPDEHRVTGDQFAAFRTGEATTSGTMVAVVVHRRHDLAERTREDAFVAMEEAERTEGSTDSSAIEHTVSSPVNSGTQPTDDGSAAFETPQGQGDEGLSGSWTLQNTSSGTSQVSLQQSGSHYVLTGMGPEIVLQPSGDSWIGQGAVLFGQGGHQIRLTPQAGGISLQASNSTGGSFTTMMVR